MSESNLGIARMLLRRTLKAIRRLVINIDNKTGLVSLILTPYVVYKSETLNAKALLDELFSSRSILPVLYKPIQIKWEVKKLLEILARIKPRCILEIGTARGGTLFSWTRVASDDALIISVDLPGGPFGGGYPILKGLTYKFFARGNQKIVLIRGDSHDIKTLEKVKKILGDKKLDFLFIDGDHSYEGVKRDFEMYAPLVREGGIIAFHDIVPGPSEYVGGVPKFWQELKEKFGGKVLEIVYDWSQGGYGIGVIFK